MVVERRRPSRIEINLDGPEGNAFALLAYANRLALRLGLDAKEVQARMTESDYDNLVAVFEEYFSDVAVLYRVKDDDEEDEE